MPIPDEIKAAFAMNPAPSSSAEEKPSPVSARRQQRLKDLEKEAVREPDHLTSCVMSEMVGMMKFNATLEIALQKSLVATGIPAFEERAFQRASTTYFNYSRQIGRMAQFVDHRRKQAEPADRRAPPR